MSQYTIYIQAPAYLDQWLRHHFWDEESHRIEFPRGSAPHAVLSSLLRQPPRGYKEQPDASLLPVAVPTFKGINPASRNFLSDSGKTALVSACKRLFRSQMYMELCELFAHDVQITDIIYDFMDKHGIERTETNWESIRQMYLRMRKKSQGSTG